MPDESAETDYASTLFWLVQEVLLKGGFSTSDLG
jgi:hypothetical protein